MKIDTSKKYYVINEETEISIRSFKTREEAEESAKWMTEYHKEEYIVEDRSNEMEITNIQNLQQLHSKVEETLNYIVIWSDKRNKWELRRKINGMSRTLFISACEYKTPLLASANKLEKI